MLQSKLARDDPRLYDANRDIAHNAAAVVKTVIQRFDEGHWPELKALCTLHGVGPAELGQAVQAYADFIGNVSDLNETCAESLTKSGWRACPPAAQIAVMAMLGTVIAGIQWKGIRDCTFGFGPPAGIPELVAAGAEASRRMAAARPTV